ncbi:hypothetical protein GH714_006079 [Hevea brasiliensis]|uniref:Uncharacterized protein n=1 Tax=Hevea brasiliensis TaxID=3981 RepID=A0A6A6K9Z0_HEVBR|nr:hypothetical protein GH714_006079 [Hevea brasiliensis]
MQEHKIRYLQSFLQRRDDENDLSRNVTLDGCFIVEFIWKFNEGPFDKKDPIFGSDHILNALMLDLLLLENQLPFFILSELTGTAIPDRKLFVELILNTYKSFLPGPEYDPRDEYTLEEMMSIKNLVGLIQDNWQPSRERVKAYLENRRKDEKRFTRCASELREAGIKFKCVKGCNLLDVKFENGTMEIPQIKISDNTERVLRNLIAYEQMSSSPNSILFNRLYVIHG